jgi:hypothetical protein
MRRVVLKFELLAWFVFPDRVSDLHEKRLA